MKFEKDGRIVEVFDENTFNVFEREGFTVVEEEDREELVKKAKELGIKSPHLMGLDKLKEKIAESE